MRVTPEQSEKMQQICFNNGIQWGRSCFNKSNLDKPYIYIYNKEICYGIKKSFFIRHLNEEIDADLFIRTNGTCEETIGSKFQPSDEVIESVAKINGWDKLETSHYTMNVLLDTLKKKNEKHYLEKENKSLKESSKISCNMLHSQKDKIDRLELNYVVEQLNHKKEIEKLKAVI